MNRRDSGSIRTVRFWITHLVIPLALGVGAMGALHFSGLDRAAVDLAFDEQARCFPFRYHWFVEGVVHRGGKYLVVAIAVVALALLLASVRRSELADWRGPLGLFIASVVLGPLATGLGKNLSTARCPWDLARYGGFAQHEVNHPDDGTVGRRGCFPCGQASAGFALTAAYFALRRRRPCAARWSLLVGLVYGVVLGIGRVAQGAHYPSHVVGTAMVCWSAALLLYTATLGRVEAANSAR